jgi:hypothetical protein
MRCADVATTAVPTAVPTAAPTGAASLDHYRPPTAPAAATEFAAESLWAASRVAVIALRGELDAYTAPRFRAVAAA